MGLSMTRQVGGCGILLAALGANVLILQQRGGAEGPTVPRLLLLQGILLPRSLAQVILARLANARAGTGAGIRVGDGAATHFPPVEHLVAVVAEVVVVVVGQGGGGGRGGVQTVRRLRLGVGDQRTGRQRNVRQLGEVVQLLGYGGGLLVLRHGVVGGWPAC